MKHLWICVWMIRLKSTPKACDQGSDDHMLTAVIGMNISQVSRLISSALKYWSNLPAMLCSIGISLVFMHEKKQQSFVVSLFQTSSFPHVNLKNGHNQRPLAHCAGYVGAVIIQGPWSNTYTAKSIAGAVLLAKANTFRHIYSSMLMKLMNNDIPLIAAIILYINNFIPMYTETSLLISGTDKK